MGQPTYQLSYRWRITLLGMNSYTFRVCSYRLKWCSWVLVAKLRACTIQLVSVPPCPQLAQIGSIVRSQECSIIILFNVLHCLFSRVHSCYTSNGLFVCCGFATSHISHESSCPRPRAARRFQEASLSCTDLLSLLTYFLKVGDDVQVFFMQCGFAMVRLHDIRAQPRTLWRAHTHLTKAFTDYTYSSSPLSQFQGFKSTKF